MTFPTVHLNGTSRSTLIDGYTAALEKAREAEWTFRNIEFNSRDYYPQGPNAWDCAVDDYVARLTDLQKVIQHLEKHLIHLNP